MTHRQTQYNEKYYQNMDGENPYVWDSRVWRSFFGHVADKIVEELNPKTVMDAGCAIGLLVDELRQRSISAYGFDGSEYAVNVAVSNGLLGKVWMSDLTTNRLAIRFPLCDLVTCIEVVEHIQPEMASTAIRNLCGMSQSTILFSSSPDDFAEPTHVNVKPEAYWLQHFKSNGFVKTGRAPWLSEQAIILRKERA